MLARENCDMKSVVYPLVNGKGVQSVESSNGFVQKFDSLAEGEPMNSNLKAEL